MRYLKFLAKIKDDLANLRSIGQMPEAVAIPPDEELATEESRGLIEAILGIPVKVDVCLKDGFKIEVKVDFKF